MRHKKMGKRGSTIIALLAIVAALATGPGASGAIQLGSTGTGDSASSVWVSASVGGLVSTNASWAGR